MSEIAKNVEKFVQNLKKNKQKDEKLEDLILQIQNKRKNNTNKKVLIFTVFKDTAFYLYDSLCKVFATEGIAVVSGDESKSSFGQRCQRLY